MLYLDSANIEELRPWVHQLSLDGITCNPKLLAQAGIKADDFIGQARALGFDRPHQLFVQVTATDTAGMVAQARQLWSRWGAVYCKIPVSPSGLTAIHQLKRSDDASGAICATAIYCARQAFLAAREGADYLAPYVNRIDREGGDFQRVIGRLRELLERQQLPARIVAASFAIPKQLTQALLAGAHDLTVSPALLTQYLANAQTAQAVAEFASYG